MSYLIGFILFLFSIIIDVPVETASVFFITYVSVNQFNGYLLKKAGIISKSINVSFLLIFAFLLLGCILNYYTACIANGDDEFPWLVKGDYSSYHELGMYLANEGLSNDVISRRSSNTIQIGEQGINYIGFPYVAGLLYFFIYKGFITLVLYNYVISTFVITFVTITAYNIYKNIIISLYVSIYIGLIPLLCFLYIFPLKDSTIIFAFSLCFYIISDLRISVRNIILFLIAVLIFFTMRTFLFLILPAFYYVLKGPSRKLAIVTLVSILLLGFMQFYFTLLGSGISLESILVSLQGGTTYEQWSYSDNKSTVQAVIGNFSTWSPIKRLLALPLLIIVQYLMPINFWDIENNDYFYEFIVINFNIIWLLYFGPLLIFGYIHIKKSIDRITIRLAIIGFIFYALIAFSFGGVIPRYAAPFFPIFCIIMAKTQYDISQNKNNLGIAWKTFMKYYFSLLVLGAAALFLFKMVF